MISMPIAFSRSLPADRLRDIGVLAALLLWLAYTRIYSILQAAHLTAPPCPFYYLTGHPCPFCGGTRPFAYMWQGDVSGAVRLYPLGPALFAGTIVGIGGLVAGAVAGRTWTPRLAPTQRRPLGARVVAAILFSWALKVFVLGN